MLSSLQGFCVWERNDETNERMSERICAPYANAQNSYVIYSPRISACDGDDDDDDATNISIYIFCSNKNDLSVRLSKYVFFLLRHLLFPLLFPRLPFLLQLFNLRKWQKSGTHFTVTYCSIFVIRRAPFAVEMTMFRCQKKGKKEEEKKLQSIFRMHLLGEFVAAFYLRQSLFASLITKTERIILSSFCIAIGITIAMRINFFFFFAMHLNPQPAGMMGWMGTSTKCRRMTHRIQSLNRFCILSLIKSLFYAWKSNFNKNLPVIRARTIYRSAIPRMQMGQVCCVLATRTHTHSCRKWTIQKSLRLKLLLFPQLFICVRSVGGPGTTAIRCHRPRNAILNVGCSRVQPL